jgi:hypothetical protein
VGATKSGQRKTTDKADFTDVEVGKKEPRITRIFTNIVSAGGNVGATKSGQRKTTDITDFTDVEVDKNEHRKHRTH